MGTPAASPGGTRCSRMAPLEPRVVKIQVVSGSLCSVLTKASPSPASPVQSYTHRMAIESCDSPHIRTFLSGIVLLLVDLTYVQGTSPGRSVLLCLPNPVLGGCGRHMLTHHHLSAKPGAPAEIWLMSKRSPPPQAEFPGGAAAVQPLPELGCLQSVLRPAERILD